MPKLPANFLQSIKPQDITPVTKGGGFSPAPQRTVPQIQTPQRSIAPTPLTPQQNVLSPNIPQQKGTYTVDYAKLATDDDKRTIFEAIRRGATEEEARAALKIRVQIRQNEQSQKVRQANEQKERDAIIPTISKNPFDLE